jgi:hypothetical protein
VQHQQQREVETQRPVNRGFAARFMRSRAAQLNQKKIGGDVERCNFFARVQQQSTRLV